MRQLLNELDVSVEPRSGGDVSVTGKIWAVWGLVFRVSGLGIGV